MTAKTPEDAASDGLASMAAFFKPVPHPAPAPPVNKGGAPRRRHPRRWSEGGTDGGPVHWPPANDAKVLNLREEFESSQVNQVYDQQKGMSNKWTMRASVRFMRGCPQFKGVINVSGLVIAALAAVRIFPRVVGLFGRTVNLRPSTRLPFLEWIKLPRHARGGAVSPHLEPREKDYVMGAIMVAAGPSTSPSGSRTP